MDYAIHGILQGRILEWVAVPFSKGSAQPRDWTQVSHCRQTRYQLSQQGNPRIPKWVAYPFFSGSSRPRNWTSVSWIAGGFISVQLLIHVRFFATPWIAACQASLSITNSWSSLKLTSIKSVMPSSHFILCHPLFLLLPIPASIRVFSKESTLHMKWPKYWSFSFSIIPSKEYPGLISFRMDWLDLLAVQGILRSLLKHHSSKASIRWRSAFFIVQLSHPYMTTGKTIALTRRTFVGKVVFLLLIIAI